MKTTVTMYKPNGMRFTYECMSFAHGVQVCMNAYEKMGLIGRYYIECSDGQATQIN